jgi:hypothetical protein
VPRPGANLGDKNSGIPTSLAHAKRDGLMPRSEGSSTGGIAADLCFASSVTFAALTADAPPFTPDPSAGWFAYTRVFIPPPGEPSPLRLDPAYPRVTNEDNRATGGQPTSAVGDPNNPILQP